MLSSKQSPVLFFILLFISSCTATNKIGHMMVDATEDRVNSAQNREEQSQLSEGQDNKNAQGRTKDKRSKRKNDNFIEAPNLTESEIDQLWSVAIDTCYNLGKSVTLDDRRSKNLACQSETESRENVYTIRVNFSNNGIRVDSITNSLMNYALGGLATNRSKNIMIDSLSDKLMAIRPNYNSTKQTANTKSNQGRTYVYKAQSQLKSLGYNPGVIDGFMGGNTKKAILAFQKDNNLPTTGELDEDTIEKLNSMSK